MKRLASILFSLALCVPAITIVTVPQEAQAQRCSGCGCKGGPGWRSKRTGQCVGRRTLARECGSPPSTARCIRERARKR
jgi:hypothetical protein